MEVSVERVDRVRGSSSAKRSESSAAKNFDQLSFSSRAASDQEMKASTADSVVRVEAVERVDSERIWTSERKATRSVQFSSTSMGRETAAVELTWEAAGTLRATMSVKRRVSMVR